MPVCNTCRIEKAEGDFTPNRWTASGHTNKCKLCCTQYAKVWRKKNPERARQLGKAKYRRWRAANPVEPRPPLQTIEGRRCSGCETRKPPECFGKVTIEKDGLSRRCKECCKEASMRARYKDIDAARAKERAKAKLRYARHPERIKAAARVSHLKYKYDFSQAGRRALLEKQDSKCAICKGTLRLPETRGTNSDANIDHDHATGAIRGLLCPPCNKGLGCFRDNPDALRSAAEYLERHAEERKAA